MKRSPLRQGILCGFLLGLPVSFYFRDKIIHLFSVIIRIFATPDFFKDFFGVLLGSLFGWYIVIWQMNREKRAAEEEEKKYLNLYLERIATEITDNHAVIEQLEILLQDTAGSKETLLWASVKVSSFSDIAFSDLARTGYQRNMQNELWKCLLTCYRSTNFLKSLIKECEAAISILSVYGDKYSKEHLHNITVHIEKCKKNSENAISMLAK